MVSVYQRAMTTCMYILAKACLSIVIETKATITAAFIGTQCVVAVLVTAMFTILRVTFINIYNQKHIVMYNNCQQM